MTRLTRAQRHVLRAAERGQVSIAPGAHVWRRTADPGRANRGYPVSVAVVALERKGLLARSSTPDRRTGRYLAIVTPLGYEALAGVSREKPGRG